MSKPHKVDFTTTPDQDAIALAILGQTNGSIMDQTGLTDGQINYRIRKEKILSSRMVGLRAAWRYGSSEVFRKIRDDYLAVLREDTKRRLAAQLAQPRKKK